jgi:lipoprotein Spr
MRRAFTLVSLLFLFAVVAGAAYAAKPRHTHKEKAYKPAVYIPDITTDSLSSDSLLSFAHTLLGIPYRPASSDPSIGFDCSGL